MERTNYFALGSNTLCINYCNLLIMPEGIGRAYEKWKIEKLRKRAKSKEKADNRISALMGFFFGWAGAHHFHQNRSSRGASMLLLSIMSFGIGLLSCRILFG